MQRRRACPQPVAFPLMIPLACVALLCALALNGCGDESPAEAANAEKCTIDGDCDLGMRCMANVCVSEADRNPSAGSLAADAGSGTQSPGHSGVTSTPCSTAIECDDDDACTEDQCLNGLCSHQGKNNCCMDSKQCLDQSACTLDLCQDGQCTHLAAKGDGCCATDSQCDDGVVCTEDRCNAQFTCSHSQIANCCKSDSDCVAEPCTQASCEAGQCKLSKLSHCCAKASDCDDNDPCTTDSCLDEQCKNESKGPSCCAVNLECSDNDECTEDLCQNGQCVHKKKSSCGSNACGDGVCNKTTENCSSCAADCGKCAANSCTGKCGSPQPNANCSCSNYCKTLGNCCPDYDQVCSAASAVKSCKGKCGGLGVGGCQCTPTCVVAGTCCPDFMAICAGSGGSSQSCAGKCGKYDALASCKCDAQCKTYSDCCADYAQLCGNGGNTACGNGKCDAPGETCANCSKDCGPCVSNKCGANPGSTCANQCGKYSAGSACQCDSQCKQFGDCCADISACCP